jgi:hypothetical protein
LKYLSGWGSVFFHNSRRCSFLSRRSSQICLRSSIRALRSNLRIWLCATKSACFSDPREKRAVKKNGTCNIIAVWGPARATMGRTQFSVGTDYKYVRGNLPLKSSIEAFFSTHNPTHRERCLVRLTRCLAVPAVLYVVVKPNHATSIRARSVVQVHQGPPFKWLTGYRAQNLNPELSAENSSLSSIPRAKAMRCSQVARYRFCELLL